MVFVVHYDKNVVSINVAFQNLCGEKGLSNDDQKKVHE